MGRRPAGRTRASRKRRSSRRRGHRRAESPPRRHATTLSMWPKKEQQEGARSASTKQSSSSVRPASHQSESETRKLLVTIWPSPSPHQQTFHRRPCYAALRCALRALRQVKVNVSCSARRQSVKARPGSAPGAERKTMDGQRNGCRSTGRCALWRCPCPTPDR